MHMYIFLIYSLMQYRLYHAVFEITPYMIRDFTGICEHLNEMKHIIIWDERRDI